jgi:hypothetical protein
MCGCELTASAEASTRFGVFAFVLASGGRCLLRQLSGLHVVSLASALC